MGVFKNSTDMLSFFYLTKVKEKLLAGEPARSFIYSYVLLCQDKHVKMPV
jgi:hypothetical protein